MPFDAADPRAALLQNPTPAPREFAEAQLIPFTDEVAETTAAGTRQWFVRIQHAVVCFAEAVAGDRWTGPEDRETLVAVPDGPARLTVVANGVSTSAGGGSVVVVGPGASTIEVVTDGIVIRVFPAAGSDLCERCINAAAFELPAANVAPYVPMHGDQDLLSYQLGDYPPAGGRFGQIFRSANLMVNFVAIRDGPRDPSRLSPHSHADFEQCSIQLGGDFVHHVRTPWTPNLDNWRDDQHLELSGAGAVIFPPPLEHTSQAVGAGSNRLIDVFAPPRRDFLAMPDWVLNAADYR